MCGVCKSTHAPKPNHTPTDTRHKQQLTHLVSTVVALVRVLGVVRLRRAVARVLALALPGALSLVLAVVALLVVVRRPGQRAVAALLLGGLAVAVAALVIALVVVPAVLQCGVVVGGQLCVYVYVAPARGRLGSTSSSRQHAFKNDLGVLVPVVAVGLVLVVLLRLLLALQVC